MNAMDYSYIVFIIMSDHYILSRRHLFYFLYWWYSWRICPKIFPLKRRNVDIRLWKILIKFDHLIWAISKTQFLNSLSDRIIHLNIHSLTIAICKNILFILKHHCSRLCLFWYYMLSKFCCNLFSVKINDVVFFLLSVVWWLR